MYVFVNPLGQFLGIYPRIHLCVTPKNVYIGEIEIQKVSVELLSGVCERFGERGERFERELEFSFDSGF